MMIYIQKLDEVFNKFIKIDSLLIKNFSIIVEIINYERTIILLKLAI
jgi:hypothetical protein